MKIIQDTKNSLLKRREVKFLIESPSNPGFPSSLKTVSEQFKAPEENIAVKAVKSKFGRNTFLIDAYIYDTSKDKSLIEPKPKVKKKTEGQ